MSSKWGFGLVMEICDSFTHVSLSALFIEHKLVSEDLTTSTTYYSIFFFLDSPHSDELSLTFERPTSCWNQRHLPAQTQHVPTIHGGSYICIYVTMWLRSWFHVTMQRWGVQGVVAGGRVRPSRGRGREGRGDFKWVVSQERVLLSHRFNSIKRQE